MIINPKGSVASDLLMTVKMYLVVNSSVKMGVGKIAGQVGHGISEMVRRLERRSEKEEYKLWLSEGETKIIVKAPEEELLLLLKNHPRITYGVRDLGKTQVNVNTLTVVAFMPLNDSEIPKELKEYKLL